MKILTGTQHAELDRYTIENEHIESIDLMERASEALADEIISRWDNKRTVFVFAGAGNNGGDGLAVARLLVDEGYRVVVYLFNVKGTLSVDCEINRDRLIDMMEADESVCKRLVLKEISQGFDFPRVRPQDIVVDALFGTGLRSSLSGGFAVVARKINATKAHVVSIDVPSGLMCEDNAFIDRNVVVHAELTLTIGLPKLAFLLPENEQCTGEWKVLDIGLSEEWIEQASTPYSILEKNEIRELLHQRSAFAHKGTMGHALLVAGSYGMAGASILASKACLRSGIGKLSLHTCAANNAILQTSVPETIILPDKNSRHISEAVDMQRYQAVGIGPGIGQDELTEQTVKQYVAMASEPLVIDADALNILGNHRDWISHIPTGSILTPHVKELEGIVGSCSNSFERLGKAVDLATQCHIYVIVKGHYTAICTPHGKVRFCPLGNAGMATPGSGDVLTGILTGLLAQGYTPGEASMIGVWLHAAAGDAAAEELTEECMLAGDIISHMPHAYRQLKQ